MADKSIVELGIAQQMTDDALLPVYLGGETRSIEGALIKKYARDSVKVHTDAAREHAAAAEASKNAAAQSAAKSEENADKTAADVLVVKSAADAERERVAAEDVRRTAETSRETEEGRRTAAERDRSASETARREAEEGREAAEQLRADETAGIVARAKVHADDAAASKAAAAISETNAGTSATNAAKSKADALTAQKAAEAAKSAAESSATLAGGEAEKASQSAASAGNSATEAAGSATAASKAKTDAEDAEAAAQTAQAGAEVAKAAAQTAQGKAEAARDAAGASSTAAAGSAQTAIAKAGEAAASAGAAKTSETNAKSSETAAGESADVAEQARQAIEALGVQGVTLSPGSQVTVEKLVAADGAVTLKFSIPQGAKGDKGEIGDQGVSVASIKRTSGTGAAGTTDTYTITLSSGATSTFQVYNGRDGEGAGDMTASVYDPQGKSQDVFAYTDTSIAGLPVKRLVGTTEAPIDIDALVEPGRYYLSGEITSGANAEEVWPALAMYLAAGAPIDVIAVEEASMVRQTMLLPDGEPGSAASRILVGGTFGVFEVYGAARAVHNHTPAQVGALPSTGGTLTGPLAMSGNKVTGVGAPTADDDAATKGYADDAVEKHILTANRNVYVSNDGSDETGDGTQERPWATIQKAVDEAPEVSGEFLTEVCVAGGNYTGFTLSGKRIKVSRQNTSEKVILNSGITVTNGAVLLVQQTIEISLNGSGTALNISYDGFVYSNGSINISNCGAGVYAIYGGKFFASSGVRCTNCKNYALAALRGGFIESTLTGEGNLRNLYATSGGFISCVDNSATPGTKPDTQTDGGIIISNLLDVSQKGVAGGLATLDESGKVFGEQLPAISADDIPFSDGETFQQKLDAGKLTGRDGAAGKDGKDGATGATGKTGATGAQGPQGTPTTVNGKSGTSITLTAADVGALPVTGGTVTGSVNVVGDIDITDGIHVPAIVTMQILDANGPAGKGFLIMDGVINAIGAPISMGENKITDLAGATAATDAANKEYVDSKTLVFTGKTVPASAWAANPTYSAQGYGFRASVACTGVTASHRPDVAFGAADAVDGNFAPISESYAGGVYIYCKEKPTATITIPSIVCVKGA